LERQIDVSNQNLKQFEAAVREARAEVREQQSSFFPSLTVTPQVQRQKTSLSAITSYSVQGIATWEPDLWGKVRRNVESSVANGQATSPELAAAKLSAQAQLATNYIELHYADSLKDLLDATVKGYQRSLEITQNQYAVGTVARSDVITAEAQLLAAQAQEVNVGVQRAQFEHAIALLVGKTPAGLSLARAQLPERVPVVPTDVPSTLLERRPDMLSGGQRSAAVAAARANYDKSVANYRETVLTAFQNVEDELSTLRVLAQQIGVERAAVQSAQRAVEISLNEYQAGTVPYTTVITAQATLLSIRRMLSWFRRIGSLPAWP
jgi:outer membrane protein TolC